MFNGVVNSHLAKAFQRFIHSFQSTTNRLTNTPQNILVDYKMNATRIYIGAYSFACLRRMRRKIGRKWKTIINFIKSFSYANSKFFYNKLFWVVSHLQRPEKKIIEILNKRVVPAKSSWDKKSQDECKKCVLLLVNPCTMSFEMLVFLFTCQRYSSYYCYFPFSISSVVVVVIPFFSH